MMDGILHGILHLKQQQNQFLLIATHLERYLQCRPIVTDFFPNENEMIEKFKFLGCSPNHPPNTGQRWQLNNFQRNVGKTSFGNKLNNFPTRSF